MMRCSSSLRLSWSAAVPSDQGVFSRSHDAPLEDRREALDKLLSEVRLSPGGVVIRYGLAGYHIHDPQGPPYAPMSFCGPPASSYLDR